MYNPKDIFTEDGYDNYLVNLKNLENALFKVMNDADDLHIGALDTKQEDTIHNMMNMVTGVLLTGDGETDD